jgi:glycosyltransferase involved in cell wall biosynthesis
MFTVLEFKMKILHINSYDYGGAAIAAIRLHKALLGKGVDSSILFYTKTNNSVPNSYAYVNNSKIRPAFIKRQWIRIKNKLFSKFTPNYRNNQKLKNKPEGFEMFSFNPTDFDITKQKIYQEADIIHLHWIAGFVDFRFFKKNTKPVIWTLHDMNPFTGGCHYSCVCENYISDCINCPQLNGTKNSNNSFIDQQYKKSNLVGQSLIITAPSKWLTMSSAKSRLFRSFEHITIPYSLDLSVFKPLNKSFCRSVLSLPQEKRILLFVSADIENQRKGFDLLINALSKIDKSDVQLCAVRERNTSINYDCDITFLGRISDERLMTLTYSAADVFVLPSREDNLPNVMLESIACGTPVIAFPVGGIVDIIKTGFNGILAENITSDSLAIVLIDYLMNKYKFNREEISKSARVNFSPILQAERYLRLYMRMLDKTSNIN